MRQVLQRSDARLDAFRRRPLYAFLANGEIAPERRLSFIPQMAHFIMSFADLCALVLPEQPPADPWQALVNAHAGEDCDHWQWYLNDLGQLGHDGPRPLSESLRLVWGKSTEKGRLLTYRLCALGWGADSLQKLVLVAVLEATAKLGMEHTSRVARELAGKELLYFGSHHLRTERAHRLLSDENQAALRNLALDGPTRDRLCAVVDQAFDAFTDFVDELYRSIL